MTSQLARLFVVHLVGNATLLALGYYWLGFAEFGAKRKSWIYWLAIPMLVVLAVWLPFRLMNWTPAMSTFSMETASLIARFGLAYLLFVAGCLLLAFITSRGDPSASQP